MGCVSANLTFDLGKVEISLLLLFVSIPTCTL
ncbi:hypothetical protein T4B_8850 [Trichinella pseudospiralis]|uniref:Uncharacterized protein n=1 Tax=Trichinella pseudospiralis TaxID=6337 RepID=A0A0V1GJA0_TRIPS|nr:hypothetical protein T4B_8850 [Trichinella pseudospiralis]KRZ29861.1 hypothetical protein T4C_11181 [Trichinella pseudospiralis]